MTVPAVVWKITPLFAEWIAWEENVFFKTSALDADSTVLELGCGVSGILGLTVSTKVRSYIATDQEYVFKLLKQNLEANSTQSSFSRDSKQQGRKAVARRMVRASTNIEVVALDWESSLISSLPSLFGLGSSNSTDRSDIDVIVACDCVFNEALIDPFVGTCDTLCRLAKTNSSRKPTICIIAQQIRSHLVFEAWLLAFCSKFRVWRVPDRLLLQGLREDSGFVIHVGILRDEGTDS